MRGYPPLFRCALRRNCGRYDCEYAQERLGEFFSEFGFLKFHNDTDLKLIISAGLGERDGITLVMGTGICAFSVLDGKQFKTAGWGYLIDEGGSAYNLGRDALSAYFFSIDGSGEKTLITEEIDKMYPEGSRSLIGYVYEGGKKNVASFAPAVINAYKRGDSIAKNILIRNMKYAVKVMETAAMKFKSEPIDVVIAGGLTKEPILVELFKASVSSPDRYRIRALSEKPVIGAVRLAEKLMEERNA